MNYYPCFAELVPSDVISLQTWVGNKRRKLASKVDQNGGVSHSLPNHGLAGGLLSNHALAGAALSNHSLTAGALLPAEMAAARTIQSRVHLLPPSPSFPPFTATSSSPSSSSPLSSGSNNKNNNDVILTGIYSLNSVSRSRSRPTAPAAQSDSELSVHTSSSLINQALQSRNSSTTSPLHSKLASLSQNLPSLTSASGPLVYTAVRKGTLPHGESGVSAGAGVVPHTWTKQYGTVQARAWSSSSQSQAQPQSRPHANTQPQPPAIQKTLVSLPAQTSSPVSEQTPPRIQQVFTLSDRSKGDQTRPGPAPTRKGQQSRRSVHLRLDTSHNFSIAMETGDEEDEWQREEELANMAAQTHIDKEQMSASPNRADVSVVKRSHTPPTTGSRSPLLHSNSTLQGSYTAQTSLTGEASSQVGKLDSCC